MAFDEKSARAWMLEQRELARDLETGRVLPRELAERCALALDAAHAGGPLEDDGHWLHELARQVADESEQLGELVVVRLRSTGRTYWMVADREVARTYAPHVSQRDAVARFEDEVARRHARVVLYREQHKPAAAAKLLQRVFGARS